MATLIGPRTIKLADIKLTFFVRKSLDDDRVLLLGGLYENGTKIPPIVVNTNNELIDGRHRYEAMLLLGWKECKALIDTSTARKDNILSALKANMGGSLPPKKADFMHTIELLLSEGTRQRDIIEMFPLPASMTKSMISTITKTVYNKKIGYAVDKVVTDGLTVPKAAEQFGVAVDDLKAVLGKRKKRGTGTSDIIKGLEFRTRSYSQFLSKQAQKIKDGIEDTRYTHSDMDIFMARAGKAVKAIVRTWERFKERAEAAPSIDEMEE